MKGRYSEWIVAQRLPDRPCGLCESVSRRMVAAFPELRLVRGHFNPWGETKQFPHWWCVESDGTIVDPTAAQFIGVGPGDYVEHIGDEPTGRCLECGLYTFNGESFCDRACAEAWATWLNALPPLPARDLPAEGDR